MKMGNNTIQITLKAARINAGMTQQEAADKFGVSKKTISNWESGLTFPDVMKIKLIEQIYGVRYDNIIFIQQNYA